MNKENQKLLLVSGCPRSGTTLINFILNSHPEVVTTNELDLIKISEQFRKIAFSKKNRFNKNTISRDQSSVESWSMDDFSKLIPSNNQLIARIIKIFCLSIDDSKSPIYYGDKTPTYYLYDPEKLVQLSENSSIYVLHITRNPQEVVHSIRRRTTNSIKGKDYWKSVVTTKDALTHWVNSWNARKLFKDNKNIRFLDLNYNAFVENQKAGYDLISEFLEVQNDFEKTIINTKRKEKSKIYIDSLSKYPQIEHYSNIWHKLPLNLNECEEILSVPQKSIWNKIKRKSLISFIKVRRTS